MFLTLLYCFCSVGAFVIWFGFLWFGFPPVYFFAFGVWLLWFWLRWVFCLLMEWRGRIRKTIRTQGAFSHSQTGFAIIAL